MKDGDALNNDHQEHNLYISEKAVVCHNRPKTMMKFLTSLQKAPEGTDYQRFSGA